jgi:hypothetical protein
VVAEGWRAKADVGGAEGRADCCGATRGAGGACGVAIWGAGACGAGATRGAATCGAGRGADACGAARGAGAACGTGAGAARGAGAAWGAAAGAGCPPGLPGWAVAVATAMAEDAINIAAMRALDFNMTPPPREQRVNVEKARLVRSRGPLQCDKFDDYSFIIASRPRGAARRDPAFRAGPAMLGLVQSSTQPTKAASSACRRRGR